MFPKILFLFFLFLCLPVHGQEYTLRHYSTDNGLPQNSVKDIVKDRYGFIWLTTENGIIRYDGLTFSGYKDLLVHNQRFTFFYGNRKSDSIAAGSGSQTVLLYRRTAKVLTDARGFGFRYRRDSRHHQASAPISYNYHPQQGTPFYLKLKEGDYFITDSSLTFRHRSIPGDRVLKLHAVFNNRTAVFTLDDRLYHIDYASRQIRSIVNGRIARSFEVPLLSDPAGKVVWSQVNNTVFIVRNRDIYRLTFREGRLATTRLAVVDGLDPQYLTCIYYDSAYRQLYLGSSIDGLQVLRFSQFVSTRKKAGRGSVFYATLPYGHSAVITPQGEIYGRKGILNNKRFDTDGPYFMTHDRERNIIVQDSGRLYRYLKTSSFTIRSLAAKSNTTFVDFLYDRERYYAVTRPTLREFTGGSLLVYQGTSFGTVEKKIPLHHEPTRLFSINGSLLIGTVDGLERISLKNFTKKQIAPRMHLFVRNIIRSRDGNVWILTLGKGFYLLKNDRLIRMPVDPDRNLLSPHTLMEDRHRFFWIPTNNGLYKIREEALLRYAADRNTEVRYYTYTKDAGFNTNEFNGGSNICGSTLPDGDFVLPSLKGLVFFNPLETKSLYPGNFYVERCIADGKEIRFSGNLTLEQTVQKAAVFVDVPYFANRRNVVIQLNRGGNDRWENLEPDMKFSVSGLPPGNHIFTLKMLISDNDTFVYRKIHIHVVPYFYQTLIFRCFCGLAAVLLVILLIRMRTRMLRKKNRALEDIIDARTRKLSVTVESLEQTKTQLKNEIEQQKKLIGTITHDITTPIKFVAHTVQDMLDHGTDDQDRLRRILTSIYKSSSQLYHFTLTLREYADIYSHHRSHEKESYALQELIREKKRLFNEIAGTSDTMIVNRVPPDIRLDISRNTLSVIIHNLLDNAVKFTSNGCIVIDATFIEDDTVITISDTGCGMSPSQIEYYTSLHQNIDDEKLLLQKYGMGLHLVLQLIHILNGSMEIHTNTPSGTVFTITLKTMNYE